MDQSDRELVRGSMRQLLARCASADLAAQLLEGGWAELLEEDARTAISVLADEQGRSLTASPALDLVLLHGAGLPLDASTAFVLPGMRRRPRTAGLVENGRTHVDGLVLAGHRRADTYLVSTDQAILAMPKGAFALEPVLGADPELGLHRANGEVAAADERAVAGADAWIAAMAAGRRSLAAELLGLAERMLEDTVSYVLARHQFGRPIASFQTVKHRLADVRVAVSAARSALGAAWDDGDPASALAAKCLAGRAHRVAAANCHQVHGGIAFTVEHGFHRLIRRGQVLDGLLGGADDLASELGRHLLDTRRVPRTPQLRMEGPMTW
jgi:alkylation response protein AidB-like acyl-CoA dehydrogenase